MEEEAAVGVGPAGAPHGTRRYVLREAMTIEVLTDPIGLN